MAKKKTEEGPNKAQLIRDFMKNNPKVGPKAVAETLNAEHNLKLTAQYVSTIKALDAKKAGKAPGRRGRAPAAAASAAVSGDLLSSLMQAKKLADSMGGVAKAKAALDALAKLGL